MYTDQRVSAAQIVSSQEGVSTWRYTDAFLGAMPRQLALYHMVICLHFPSEIPVGGFKVQHNSSMWVYTISTIERAKRLPPFVEVLEEKERMFTHVETDEELDRKLCDLFSGIDENKYRSDESKIRTLTLCMYFLFMFMKETVQLGYEVKRQSLCKQSLNL